MTISVGDMRRLTASFYNTTGNVVDPTTLTVDVKTPGGTKTTYTYGTDAEVVKNSTGVYQIDITLDEAGYWKYDWTGTGAAVASSGSAFKVSRKATG